MVPSLRRDYTTPVNDAIRRTHTVRRRLLNRDLRRVEFHELGKDRCLEHGQVELPRPSAASFRRIHTRQHAGPSNLAALDRLRPGGCVEGTAVERIEQDASE